MLRHFRSVAASITKQRRFASYVIPPPEIPSLAVVGTSDRFPVNRVFCIGRNYADHALEMGSDPKAEPPCFFSKPASAIVDCSRPGTTVPYPSASKNVHYEGELVVALRSGGRNLTTAQAAEAIYGYAVGVDLTRRDLQADAKKGGRPWDTAKGFDFSGPVGAITPKSVIDYTSANGKIVTKVDGVVKQQAQTSDMIWSIPEMIANLSQLYTLMPGDILFTGTPAGVGPVQVGSQVEVTVDGLEPCVVTVSEMLK